MKRKRKSFVFYHFALSLYNLYARTRGKRIVKCECLKELKKTPHILLVTHGSTRDIIYAAPAISHIRYNLVVTNNFKEKKALAWILKKMGVIFRNQYTADVESVRAMKAVADAGGSLALFPEGRLSTDGRNSDYFAPSLGKLLRLLALPVAVMRLEGSYLAKPRWAHTLRKGIVTVRAALLLNKEELGALSAQEIAGKVKEAFTYNDYRYAQENGYPFRGKRLAEGLENVLYRCPKCGADFTLKGVENSLLCPCGFETKIDEMGRLFSHEENSFESVPEFYDFLIEEEKKLIESGGAFEQECLLRAADAKEGLTYDEGVPGTIRYENGKFLFMGEKITLSFACSEMPLLVKKEEQYFELWAKGLKCRVYPAQKGAINKFDVILQAYHKIYG